MTKKLIGLFIFTCLIALKLQAVTPISLEKQTIAIIETNYGTMEIALFTDLCPKTTENFILLAKAGLYNNIPFHRVIPDFMIQGGDITNKDGSGGHSIWGTCFEDEFSDNLLFDRPGRVAMANRGRNTNGSQFFITTRATSWLNQKHTVFGQVVKGFDCLKKIESLGSSSGQIRQPWFGNKPDQPVITHIEISEIIEIQ